MRRCWLKVVALIAPIMVPVVRAQAQTVFFDDFDDPALPQWNLPDPTYWQYDVSNSMLNVTGLFYPSNPKSNVNYAGMWAPYAPQGDFQMDVWMGWDQSTPGPHRLEVHVGGLNGGPIIAWMGYRIGAPFTTTPEILLVLPVVQRLWRHQRQGFITLRSAEPERSSTFCSMAFRSRVSRTTLELRRRR